MDTSFAILVEIAVVGAILYFRIFSLEKRMDGLEIKVASIDSRLSYVEGTIGTFLKLQTNK